MSTPAQAWEVVEPATDPDGGEGLELAVEFAHDLRSPLTAIVFLAETLMNGHAGPVTQAQRQQLTIVYGAALGMVSMASDLVELARGDALAEKTPSRFSVSEAMQSLHDVLFPLTEERDVELRLLPPGNPDRLGFPVAVSRVLMNLATNALRHTEKGFVEVAAREIGPSCIEFSVRDTGTGMDPETVKELLTPAFGSGAGRSLSGTGLGLSICRKLLDAMGSTLRFDTRIGAGSRFHFTLELPPAP